MTQRGKSIGRYLEPKIERDEHGNAKNPRVALTETMSHQAERRAEDNERRHGRSGRRGMGYYLDRAE